MDFVNDFIRILKTAFRNALIEVDAAETPSGESFITISIGNFQTEVSYRKEAGLGLFHSPATFGQRPDEIFRSAEKAARRIGQLHHSFEQSGVVKPLGLTQIRQLVGATQGEIAAALSIRQPSVQRAEKRENVQLETLANYVHALGGRLEMSVVFPDMEARVELPALRVVA